MRLVFAGGGTGGHLYPALALAAALREEAPGSRPLFLGSDREVERRILAPTGYDHVVLSTAPFSGRRSLEFAREQLKGVGQARRVLRAFQPHVVLGLGGFPSVGPVLAAWTQGIPVVLFEPNAVAGKANWLLAPCAREAYVQWTGTRLGCRLVRSGTPVQLERGRGFRGVTREEAREWLGLPVDRPTILVMGGSQGSRAINDWLRQALGECGRARDVSFVHLAGTPEAATASAAAFRRAGCSHYAAAFLAEIGAAYRAADLAVVRGGGASLAELLAVGLPAVVVPLPTAAGDHQRHNARSFAATGAGDWIEEAELNAEALGRVVDLARDDSRLAAHRARAQEAGRPDAARTVVRRLLRLASARRIGVRRAA